MSQLQPRILIYESYSGLQEALKLILEEIFHLSFESRPLHLRRAVTVTMPDLLLVDVDDQESPFDFLASIRQQHSDLPILLIASEFSLAKQLDGLRLEQVSFITKPFSKEQLSEKVATLIRGYSTQPLRRVVQIAY